MGITPGAGSKLSQLKGKRSLLTVIQEIIAKTLPKPLTQTPVVVSTLSKTRSWASLWDKIVKEILPSVDIATDGSGDELEQPPGQPLSPGDRAIRKDKGLVETLLTAMYPIGSEEEDEIHGILSLMWVEGLDREIMALPAVGIPKAIKRRLREAHHQEVGFATAVILAATKEVRQTRLAYHKTTRKEAERKRRGRSATRSPPPHRSPPRNRKERSPSPKTPRGERDRNKRPRDEIALDSPDRSPKKPRKDTEVTPRKEWATGSGRGRVTIETLRRQEERIVPAVLTGIEGADPMDLFRSVSNM